MQSRYSLGNAKGEIGEPKARAGRYRVACIVKGELYTDTIEIKEGENVTVKELNKRMMDFVIKQNEKVYGGKENGKISGSY